MKRVLGVVALAAAALLSVPSAHAQQAVGWYGAGSLGYLQLRDNDFSTGGFTGHTEYNGGIAATLAGGYGFGNGFRAELEGGYGHSEFDSLTVNGTKFSASGDIDLWSVYGAAYYDFTVSNVKPYIGGGLGWVHSDVGRTTVGGVSTPGGDDDNWSWFAEGGVSFALNDRMDIVPAVRYIWIDNAQGGFEKDEAWLLKVGLRYRF
jgi:opacity protein-like surface antigen